MISTSIAVALLVPVLVLLPPPAAALNASPSLAAHSPPTTASTLSSSGAADVGSHEAVKPKLTHALVVQFRVPVLQVCCFAAEPVDEGLPSR